MFEPRPNEEFEPSINVKNLWTYTRKSSFNAAGIRLPGLFITQGFDVDASAFVAVVFLELWGLYSIVASIGLFDAEGNFNVLGLAVIFALFLIDVALAILRHYPAGAYCRYANRAVLAEKAHERHELRKARGLRRFLTPICTLLILLVASIKVYGFYMLSDGEINALTVSVLVSYLFAALLHINNTGYFLYGLVFSRKLRREYSKWAGASDDAHEVTIYDWRPFVISVPEDETIRLREVTAGKHEIVKETVEGNELEWVLRTWGVLTDGQLNALIVQQPTENAKASVARTGLAAQLSILDAPPLPAKSGRTPKEAKASAPVATFAEAATKKKGGA